MSLDRDQTGVRDFYRGCIVPVAAMICNLPFPITPPRSLLQRYCSSEFVNAKIEKAERKPFFMYRQAVPVEFTDAAAKW